MADHPPPPQVGLTIFAYIMTSIARMIETLNSASHKRNRKMQVATFCGAPPWTHEHMHVDLQLRL